MEALKKMNTLALAIPISVLATFPFLKEGALIFALFSTIVTGSIQLIMGINMLLNNPKDRAIKIYILGVALFFMLWIFNHHIDYNNTITNILLAFPPLLAIYLSILIYKRQ